MGARISEHDLSAFVALSDDLSLQATEGSLRLARAYHLGTLSESSLEEAMLNVTEYAAWALELAASIVRERGEQAAEKLCRKK